MSSKDIHSISCICKSQRASCCHMVTIRSRLTFSAKIFPNIQCVIAFNIVVNMLTWLALHRHHFDCTKIHPANWTHSVFQILLNSWIECIMGFLKDISAEQILGSCHSWQLFDATTDIDSFCQILSCKPIIETLRHANWGGRNLSFTTFLFDDLNDAQPVILLHLTICNKYWDDITWWSPFLA